ARIEWPDRATGGATKARGVAEEVGQSRLPRVSGGRQALQVAQAPSAHPIQHDAGAISRQMGPTAGLSDGRAKLCSGALPTRQEDGIGPTAAKAEMIRTRSRARLAHRSGCVRPSSAGRWSAAASDGRETRIRRTARSRPWKESPVACGRNRA